jgi:hypothetical protein
MIIELARLLLGLLILFFHKQVADFILNRERELASVLSRRGILLPAFPSTKFTHDLYFCIGTLIAMVSLFRLWMAY